MECVQSYSRAGIFIINSEHIAHLFLVFVLLSLVNDRWYASKIIRSLKW